MPKRIKPSYFESNCVPIAISEATGLPYANVHKACERHGWTEDDGMDISQQAAALEELRIAVKWLSDPRLVGVTLRQFAEQCDQNASYLVDTHDHTLAVVNGRIRDPSRISKKTRVAIHGKVLGVGSPAPRQRWLTTLSAMCDAVSWIRGRLVLRALRQ